MAQKTTRKPRRYYIAVFVVPSLILYSVFLAFPLLDSLRLSFYQAQEHGPDVFVGLANYRRLFGEPQWSELFWNALRNNIVYFVIHLLVQTPLALTLAALLTTRGTRLVPLFRIVLFAPTTLSFVIIGFIWQLMLSPLWGIVDSALRSVGLGKIIVPWLGDPRTALPTVALVSVWQFVGLPTTLLTAALVNIPDELIDAAQVDGASGWQVFWRVRFPLILPTVGFVTMMTFVSTFNAFDLVYVMQGSMAPPNFRTDLLGVFFYRTTFGAGASMTPNPFIGTTIATIIFLIILTAIVLYALFVQRRLVRTEY